MFANRATLQNFSRGLGRSAARNLAGNLVRDLAAVRPCNDNQRALSTASFRRTRRPMLFCRWRKTAAGALECVWRTEPQAASAGEEPGISHLGQPLRQSMGITVFRPRSTWPENYTWLPIGLSALTVCVRPSSIRDVQVCRFA